MSEYRIVNGRQSQVDAHTGQLLSRESGGGSDYVLPTATTTVKGGVKVGAHLSMNGQTLNADDQSYDDSAIVSRLDGLDSDVASLDAEKQDGLVSGTSIKTVNGESLLGSGNIEIDGGGSDYDLPTATKLVLGGMKATGGFSSGKRIGTIGPIKDSSPEMYSWTPMIDSDYKQNNWGGKSSTASDYFPQFADPLVYCGSSASGVPAAASTIAITPSGAFSWAPYIQSSTSSWAYVKISNAANAADVNCILIPFAVAFKNTATGAILSFPVSTSGNNPNAYIANTQLPNGRYTYRVYYNVVDVSFTLTL